MIATTMTPSDMRIVVIPAKPREEIRQASKLLRAAAYCRVSTDDEEQKTSYEAQIGYYTEKINKNPEWQMAGIFADEGISGTRVLENDTALPTAKNRYYSHEIPVEIRAEHRRQPQIHT